MVCALIGETQGGFMIRIGLVTYLMISTLAGQAWCCCVIDRLPVPTIWATAETEEPAAAIRCCCCKPNMRPEGKKSTRLPSPEKRNAPSDSCPCKDQGPNHALTVSPDVQIHDQLRSTSLVFEFSQLVLCSDDIGEIGLHLFDGGRDPSRTYHLNGAELLCALQVYRC